MGIKFLH